MNEAARARYGEVVEIYGWLSTFAATLHPDQDGDLRDDLFYIDSTVAGWISPGQFHKPHVLRLVLEAVAEVEKNRVPKVVTRSEELWRRLDRLRELATY